MDHREPEPYADSTGDSVPEPEAPVDPAPEGRRYPSTIGGAFYLLVLAASGVGLTIVAHGNWRLGVKWISAALVCSAVARLLLPTRDAGMLAVRRRLVDVGLLVALGVGLWILSVAIPNQPPL